MRINKLSIYYNLSLFFISSAILAYEISLMRILKIEGLGNFTFLAIGIALTGFGACGTTLLIFRNKFQILLKRDIVYILSSVGFIFFLSFSYFLSQYIHFDPLRILWDKKQIFYLFVRLILYAIPFIMASFAVIVSFLIEKSNKVYFLNMSGSGVGILLSLIAFWHLDANKIILLPICLSLLSLIFVIGSNLSFIRIIAIIALLSISFFFSYRSKLYILPYRDIKRVFNFPDAKINLKRYSPYGTFTVISSKMIRFAPGLSLTFQGNLPEQKAIFIDGDLYSTVDVSTNYEYLNYQIQALPYRIKTKPVVLTYPLAGGQSVIRSHINGASTITSSCENPLITYFVKSIIIKNLKTYESNIEVLKGSLRRFLKNSKRSFDLIEISLSDIQSSPLGGIYSQDVDYLLTTGAFKEYIEHLKQSGILAISINLKYPPRNLLKLCSILLSIFNDVNQDINGKKSIKRHLFVARSMNVALLLFKKTPLTSEEISLLKGECKKLSLDLIYYNEISENEIGKYFLEKNNIYFKTIRSLLNNPISFEKNYVFNIYPPSDNNPYFYNFIKIKNIPYFFREMGEKWLFLIESSSFINFATFITVTIVAVILIFAPYLFVPSIVRKITGLGIIFVYFSSIGIGYMAVEIILIQMLKQFYDDPVISATIILASVLIFSGFGSIFSESLEKNKKSFLASIEILILGATVSLLIIITMIFLAPIHNLVLNMPDYIRVSLSILMISPLAFMMGIPFPIGLSILKDNSSNSTIWAWSINSYFSVITATAISSFLPICGFRLLMIFSASVYFLSAIIGTLMHKKYKFKCY